MSGCFGVFLGVLCCNVLPSVYVRVHTHTHIHNLSLFLSV